MISFPAPSLVQSADQGFMIQIGQWLFGGAIRPIENANGLRIWVEGDPCDTAARELARGIFQTALGALRAWNLNAGELEGEVLLGLGAGAITDEAGRHWVALGPANDYSRIEDKLAAFVEDVGNGLDQSQPFSNALWLNGNASRTAADYYVIHEYAMAEFGGTKGIERSLGLSQDWQKDLTQAANNLSPLRGGRHAGEKAVPRLDLEAQRRHVTDLLSRWARSYGPGTMS